VPLVVLWRDEKGWCVRLTLQQWNKPPHFSLIGAGGIEKKGVVRTLRHFVSSDYMNSRSVHDEAQWRFALWTMKVHLTACY
jgi:hypothetical protein